jgi:hypothetical protein
MLHTTIIRNRCIPGLSILLLSIPLLCSAVSPQSMRAHFEWGEYDTLLVQLVPYVSALPDSVDSAVIANYYCYIAVARFASGKVGDARESFIKAFHFDTGVQLDKRYVTEEMLDLFNATGKEYRNRQLQKIRQDSLAIEQQNRIHEDLRRELEHQELTRRMRIKTGLTVTNMAAGTVFGGLALYMHRRAAPGYERLKTAAAEGDRSSYTSYKKSVEATNVTVVCMEILSAITYSAGVTFLIQRIKAGN